MQSKGKEGKKFEQDFKASVPESAYYYRIKDSANSWQKESTARFTPKNEFDAILYEYPVFCALELKSTKGTSFSFLGSSPMIKKHQIEELEKASKVDGIFSGFIFNFREPEDTYFLGINEFITFTNLTDKVSINKADIIRCGGVKINSEKKITRYKYDVEGFLELCRQHIQNKITF